MHFRRIPEERTQQSHVAGVAKRRSRVRWARVVAGILACNFAAVGQAQDGGIEIFSGETLFEQGTRLSLTHLYERRSGLREGTDRISDPTDAIFERHRLVLGANYGVTPHFTAAALVPIVRTVLDQDGPGASALDSFGLGDTALLAKLKVHSRHWPRGAFSVSVVLGSELPTGSTDERDGGTRLSPSLQPGSGSLDPFASVAASLDSCLWRFDGQLFYKWNTEGARDYDGGDLATAAAIVAYRFLHDPYPGPSHSARIGLLYRFQGRAEQRGRLVHDSGSTQILVRSGLTFHPNPAWDIVVNVDVPAYQSVRGRQLGQDVRTFLGFGYRF